MQAFTSSDVMKLLQRLRDIEHLLYKTSSFLKILSVVEDDEIS